MDELSAAASNLDLIKQSTNPATSKADQDRQKLADDFDDFLLLLTTQLQHQDPTEPLDTNQFTEQLVMFASVEQQIATNTNMEKLLELNQAQGVDSAVGYIGKLVEARGNSGFLTDGVAPFIYSLDRPAEKVSVVITDAAGRAVFSGNGSGNSGKNLVTWDGSNSFTGTQMQEGTYNLQVHATDFNGEEIEVTTFTTGRVSAVELNEGELNLTVGGQLVPISEVLAIREVPEDFGGTNPDNSQGQSGDQNADSGEETESEDS